MAKKHLRFQSPKGMHDILPQEQPWWDRFRKDLKGVADYYNFLRIDPSILESANLFEKSVGEATDIIEKQMFILKDKSGDRLVLRPEATASVARAYLQHGLSHLRQPLKLYYEGPMFRYERPQAGRYRQHHQAGFEIMGGDNDSIYESQVILPIFRLLESLKLKKITVRINTIGCKNCRPAYVQKVRSFYKQHQKEVCKNCIRRLKANPLRLLDCDNPECKEIKQNAPIILDFLCTPCSRHFKEVLEYLEAIALPYQLDHHLVRGLDYYNRTVFEIFAEDFDFAIGGGGRYDRLFEVLGSRSTSAVGGSLGIERVIEVMKAKNVNVAQRTKPKVFLIHIGAEAKKRSLSLIEEFRKDNIHIIESLGKDSLKAQMRSADKEGATLALIFGQKEAYEGSMIIRDLKTGVQETVPLKKVAREIKKRL